MSAVFIKVSAKMLPVPIHPVKARRTFLHLNSDMFIYKGDTMYVLGIDVDYRSFYVSNDYQLPFGPNAMSGFVPMWVFIAEVFINQTLETYIEFSSKLNGKSGLVSLSSGES